MTGDRAKRTEPLPIDLLAALEDEWRERGPGAIATLREYDPGAYLRIIARVVADPRPPE